jgi:hypothetical protein
MYKTMLLALASLIVIAFIPMQALAQCTGLCGTDGGPGGSGVGNGVKCKTPTGCGGNEFENGANGKNAICTRPMSCNGLG